MNEDIIKGRWKEIKGEVKKQWGKLTDDDLTRINGSHEVFLGRLQERYGYQKDQAKKELDKFMNLLEKKA